MHRPTVQARVLDPSFGRAEGQRLDLDVERDRDLWFEIAYNYQQFDDYENAARWFQALCDHLEGTPTRWAHYNLACIEALEGRPEEAMAHLEAAFQAGFLDVAWMSEDGDLRSLRERPDFQALRVRMESGDVPPSEGGATPAEPAPEPTDPSLQPAVSQP